MRQRVGDFREYAICKGCGRIEKAVYFRYGPCPTCGGSPAWQGTRTGRMSCSDPARGVLVSGRTTFIARRVEEKDKWYRGWKYVGLQVRSEDGVHHLFKTDSGLVGFLGSLS